MSAIITSKSVISETAFNYAGRDLTLTLEEVDYSGHLSWSAYVTDRGDVKLIVLDYDSDEECWVAFANTGMVEHKRIMAAIVAVLEREHTNEHEYA